MCPESANKIWLYQGSNLNSTVINRIEKTITKIHLDQKSRKASDKCRAFKNKKIWKLNKIALNQPNMSCLNSTWCLWTVLVLQILVLKGKVHLFSRVPLFDVVVQVRSLLILLCHHLWLFETLKPGFEFGVKAPWLLFENPSCQFLCQTTLTPVKQSKQELRVEFLVRFKVENFTPHCCRIINRGHHRVEVRQEWFVDIRRILSRGQHPGSVFQLFGNVANVDWRSMWQIT